MQNNKSKMTKEEYQKSNEEYQKRKSEELKKYNIDEKYLNVPIRIETVYIINHDTRLMYLLSGELLETGFTNVVITDFGIKINHSDQIQNYLLSEDMTNQIPDKFIEWLKREDSKVKEGHEEIFLVKGHLVNNPKQRFFTCPQWIKSIELI